MFFTKRVAVVFFCFFFALHAYAQGNGKAIALKQLLFSIEKQYQVSFNYTENTIANLKISPPATSLSLLEKIAYLSQKTGLSFEIINTKFISIHTKMKPELPLICGYIFSSIDGTPLENANIEWENNQATTSDKNGYFEFKNQKKTNVTISYIGFIPQKIEIVENQNTACQKIYLTPNITQLEEIKTTSFLATGISKNKDGSFEIKPKKFGILPGLIEPDVLQTMQQIPGINSADESVASINVRGGTHDQNLFLWNGIKMYQTGHFFGLISVFNPNLAHTIAITKNGTSAFFGESVSSVVDISSNSNTSDKNSFSAGINMINADIYAKFKVTQKGFLELAGRRSITDFLQSPTYEEYYKKAFQNTSVTNSSTNQTADYDDSQKFNFHDITAKYSQKIGQKDHVILDLITISDQLKVFQSNTLNSETQSESNVLYQKNYGGNLYWKHHWNTKNKTQINVYSSHYELDAETRKNENNQFLKQENSMIDNGIKLENNHFQSSKLTLNTGYQFNEIGATNLDKINSPAFYRKIKTVLRTHAAILEGKYNDTLARVYAAAGVRINYIEQFQKAIIEPRLQLNYGISKYFSTAFLGEFKSQNCHQIIDLQTDYFGVEKRRWILSNNSTIPIQKSQQASISFAYAKKDWLLSVEHFYKKVSGITSASQGFQNQLEFVKINGSYAVLGSEVLVQKKTNHFITWLSYTYNTNNYNFGSLKPPTFANNFEINHVVSWSGSYEKNNFKIALGSKWYSGKPETTPSTIVINTTDVVNPKIDFNSPNNQRLNSFFQVNFSTTYKWESQNKIRYNVGLSVVNILNKKNEINEYYRINTATNTIEDVKTYALKRTPNISFRVSL
ncbi:carboxypeptidase-like regulatory domain-containing protein [Flavobacterium restrictum]|uniref:TonB-dependent receptor n=1 Tax=Flavobacterium restrictum TaxID=2594428 RepID=A0A553E2E2_9FLAO|nr:carboxypeptidase-like regulatory domain-containing protein [Flavobacterium restrictum]TRX39214.1 TonB-dependent receptor [Flavobacterium restrictum]